MAVLQIVGNQSGAGKTSLAAALLVTAIAAGKQVAYYKPFATDSAADPDVAFISQLLQSSGGPAVPAPAPQAGPAGEAALEKVRMDVSKLESETGLVVIEGSDASPAIALNSKVILVHRYSAQVGAAVEAAFEAAFEAAVEASTKTAGPDLAAIVVNAVPIHRRDQAARSLHAQSLPLAVIPESRGMLTVTVEQLAEHLGGKWVLDPVNIDVPVERFMIGGNIMDEGPTYFGRYTNQAVITRVERPDIQMACMGSNTCCLVLTGPGEPTDYIKAEALKRDLPLIQVRSGTHDTADALAGLLDKADARTAAKAHHFAGLLEKYMGADAVGQLLS